MDKLRIQKETVMAPTITPAKMSWKNIFKDDNTWNEKSIVGFISFLIMVIVMIADLVSGILGKDLVINEFVYDAFVLLSLGCFGIAGLEKFASKK